MIHQVFAAFEERLRQTMAAVGDDSIPTMAFGAKALSDQDTYPRLVWIPRGGRADRKAFTSHDRRDNPRMLWTRHLTVEAHVYGENEAAVEKLANHMVAVLDELAGGAYSMLGEEWPPSETTTDGVKAVVSFEVRMPWMREPLLKVKPTSVAITGVEFVDKFTADPPVDGNVA